MTWQQRLDSVLRSWEGTPWMFGQCCRGRAVDCRYFVVGVMDELYGITLPLPPRLARDTAANNRPAAMAAMRAMIDRYPCELSDGAFEPGDVIVVRPAHAHADTLQHLAIVGLGKQIWHAGGAGVAFTSMGQWTLARHFRTLEKESRWPIRQQTL